jgi:RNA processing factor Prp31
VLGNRRIDSMRKKKARKDKNRRLHKRMKEVEVANDKEREEREELRKKQEIEKEWKATKQSEKEMELKVGVAEVAYDMSSGKEGSFS